MAGGVKNISMRSSMVNRPTCGGPKKCGLSPTVGQPLSSNPNMLRATNTLYGLTCRSMFSNTMHSSRVTMYF